MKDNRSVTRERARWVLAFDASCSTCREISRAVKRACHGRLEVLPLNSVDVQQWRAASLGPEAPWAPTLIRLRDPGARQSRELRL